MEQYYRMLKEEYKGKDGKTYKVLDFRNRILYPDTRKVEGKMDEANLLRVDLIAKKYTGSEMDFSRIIDANDKDVFSFSTGDTIYLGIE
jgi:DNA-directed RNA polymerase sigma subunit (sigma70/sigma32)